MATTKAKTAIAPIRSIQGLAGTLSAIKTNQLKNKTWTILNEENL